MKIQFAQIEDEIKRDEYSNRDDNNLSLIREAIDQLNEADAALNEFDRQLRIWMRPILN